jgi:hypothetical protein
MVGSLSYTLARYYLTRNMTIAGNVQPWATPTVLWPTFMLLAIATITFIMNFVTLCTYMCGVRAANKASSVFKIIGFMLLAVHVIAWAVTMGLFKMANTGNDLWGFSCSPTADALTAAGKDFANYGKLCKLNVRVSCENFEASELTLLGRQLGVIHHRNGHVWPYFHYHNHGNATIIIQEED